MARHHLTRLLVLVALVSAAAVHAADESIKLQSVDRKINLNSQFARVTETIKVKNLGSKALDRVTVCQLRGGSAVIAQQKVSQVQDSSKTKLKLSPASPAGAPAYAVCWEAALEKPIPKGDVGTLETLFVLADAQQAYPAEVRQGEQQLMLYVDNVYALSPYSVSAQTTEVVLPTSTVKSYTDSVKPVSKSDNKISYGKYDLIKPFTLEELKLHFENNKPFKKVLSLVREVEVSHWGNIYVEEQYELKNAGAKHAGVFSRLRFAHAYEGKGNSFQELRARLPGSAHSLYYVDLIGNISSSNTRKTKTETVLDFTTRYPLMGGWKVDFKLGYSVPLGGFLGRLKSGRRRLTIDFSTPIEGCYVEDLVVKVVLPEGATDITYSLPYPVDSSRSTKYTYLDVTGRPVLVLHKAHVVPEHAAKLTVDYSFPAFGEAREPLLLVAAFATLFLLVVVYNRLEFTINRDDKWQASQEAEKVATVMQTINSLLDEQDEVVESTLRLAGTISNGQDADEAAKDKAGYENTFTSLENKIKGLLAGVAAVQPRTADKVRELQDKARALQQRVLKLLADRSDLVKKGTTGSDAYKKLQPVAQALADARAEYASAVQAVFAPY